MIDFNLIVKVLLLAILVMTVIQTIRLAAIGARKFDTDTPVILIALAVLRPPPETTFTKWFIGAINYYFNIISGRTVSGFNAVSQSIDDMSEEEWESFHASLDETITYMDSFVTPNVILPAIERSESSTDYYCEVDKLVSQLIDDLNTNKLTTELTARYITYTRRDGVDAARLLELIQTVPNSMEAAWIDAKIAETK